MTQKHAEHACIKWINDLGYRLAEKWPDINEIRRSYGHIARILNNAEVLNHCMAAIMCCDPEGTRIHIDAARNVALTYLQLLEEMTRDPLIH